MRSVMIRPPMIAPMSMAATVMMGISALRSPCLTMTARSRSPSTAPCACSPDLDLHELRAHVAAVDGDRLDGHDRHGKDQVFGA